jgi:ParB family chromosome partitioning protein
LTLVQHSAASVEHYTPAFIVEPARRLLGGFDLDPASCAQANETIRASTFYSHGGLSLPWFGRVWLNPPGGKLHKETWEPIQAGPGLSAQAVWWARLWLAHQQGHVQAAVFLCFSLNVFQNSQGLGVPPPYACPFVVPSKRIAYEGPGKRSGPSHPNALAYLGPDPAGFAREYAEIGHVRL